MAEVSNETLAEMIRGVESRARGIELKGDERHHDNVKRLEGILTQVTLTNGRLRTAENTIAQHTWAFAAIAAGALVWLGVWLTKVL